MNDLPAINELIQFGNLEMTKDEILNWVRKHNKSFNSFKNYPKSRSRRLFYQCYTNLFDLCRVIYMEKETKQALKEFQDINIDDELQLLKWLVEYEYMKSNFVDLCGNTITEESISTGRGRVFKGIDVYFKTKIIQNCIDFDIVYTPKYRAMYKKYDTLTEKESDELIPWDDNYTELTSLKFHLKKRGLSV